MAETTTTQSQTQTTTGDPMVDSIAKMGPIIELATKGGIGVASLMTIVAVIFYTNSITTASIEKLDTRIEATNKAMVDGFADTSKRITALETHIAVQDALQNAQQAAKQAKP